MAPILHHRYMASKYTLFWQNHKEIQIDSNFSFQPPSQLQSDIGATSYHCQRLALYWHTIHSIAHSGDPFTLNSGIAKYFLSSRVQVRFQLD